MANELNQLRCAKCGALTQSTNPLKICPNCEAPNPDYHEPVPEAPAATDQTQTGGQGGSPAALPAKPVAPLAANSPAMVATVKESESVSVSVSAAPAAPVESMATKVEKGLAIGLDDVDAVAGLIAKSFAGTPIATIFALLGPAAGIGAAVLHQHLLNVGFDLSQLKPIPTV